LTFPAFKSRSGCALQIEFLASLRFALLRVLRAFVVNLLIFPIFRESPIR
jgi:hypothetical protein